MARGEFELIDRYFRRPLPERDDVLIGIGDDGAVLRLADGRRLVTTMATLGEQAFADSGGDAARLGHDVMAVAMNRLAAAGAQPAWATLALTLPSAEDAWLAAFSDALFAVAAPWSVALVGGDTTRGPFTATLVGHGLLGAGSADARPCTRAGDGLYVSGLLGAGLLGTPSRPATLRVELGRFIRARGGAAVDLSDGLGAALATLLGRESLGARVAREELPLESGVRRHLDDGDAWPDLARHRGDMELAFSIADDDRAALLAHAGKAHTPVARIATVDDSGVVVLVCADGRSVPLAVGGDATP